MSMLFDKLTQMTLPTAETEKPAMFQTAAAEMPLPVPAASGALLDKLKSLGGEKAVNPPAPASGIPEQTTCIKNPDHEKLHGEGTCPHCHQTFKCLSRHKCKDAPTGQAQEPTVATEPKGTLAPPPENTPQVTQPAAPPTEGAKKVQELTEGKVKDSELDGYVLILDAIFERNETMANCVRHFSNIIAPLACRIAHENKQVHWGAVEFGRGGPLLAAKLEQWIRECNPQGVILADSTTPELRAVKEILKRFAKVIIQGVR